MRPLILVVDDDDGVQYTLRAILEAAEMDVHSARDGVEALAWLEDHAPDLVITDLSMPNMDGMSLLARMRALPRMPRTIVVTAHGSERQAVEALKLGAFDYFPKPFDVDVVVASVERAISSVRLREENERLRAELHLARHMVFVSDSMRRVAQLVQRVAPRDVTVLITGPTGTGKERVAEAVVAGSSRASKPFVRFNCASIPRELAESELFGHARGAYTGAHRARVGLFREADGGTLLMDEIGELDVATQGKILRVLQEGVVRPVGEDRDVKVDVRLVAATHRDLSADVAAGRFREDLYYRLHVVEIRVPPLADRPDDVGVLVDHFVRMFAERFGIAPPAVSMGLRDRLARQPWKGNVRELEHTVERLVALCDGEHLDEALLAEMAGGDPAADVVASASAPGAGLRERVEAFEKGLIEDELKRCQGNRAEAARRLGIGRVTLFDKCKKYGL